MTIYISLEQVDKIELMAWPTHRVIFHSGNDELDVCAPEMENLSAMACEIIRQVAAAPGRHLRLHPHKALERAFIAGIAAAAYDSRDRSVYHNVNPDNEEIKAAEEAGRAFFASGEFVEVVRSILGRNEQ